MRRLISLLALVGLAAPSAVAAATILRAAPPGQLAPAPGGRGSLEHLTLEPDLAAALLRAPLEEQIEIADWPVAPGLREPVVVRRHDVYAPDARIVAIVEEREIELPRSRLVFFWGESTGSSRAKVLVTVDPDARTVSGSSMSARGNHDLLPPEGAWTESLLVPQGALDPETGGFRCGLDDLPDAGVAVIPGPSRGAGPTVDSLSTTHTAVFAFDTDNEVMGTKFSDNTTTATNYIAQLVAGINAIYHRDLWVRALQGYTILRLSTTPDPYVQTTTGSANAAQLNEVSDYWNANYGAIRRAVTVMLSGKQPSGGWSGIAWVGGLCNSRYGVSFNQVSRSGTTAGTGDFQLVGHEVGHNFGASHTHCTDTDGGISNTQPIDRCYAGESCSSGPWNPAGSASCPAAFTVPPANGSPIANVRGTLMSYCHLLSGCGVTNVFHPLSISLAIGPRLDAAVGQCLFAATTDPAPAVSAISPNGGLTGGGTSVTIDGSGFRSPATVVFADASGAVAATSVSVLNATRITATTPSHAAGVTDVVVQNPDRMTATLRSGFTFSNAPTVTAVAPNSGLTAGGTTVRITGTSFASPATVSLGGTAAGAVSVVNSTTITAVTPAHAAGIVDVVVSSSGLSATLASGFQYDAPPPQTRFYTLAPCRLVDTRNASGPLGGPALAAQASRLFALAGTCGVPSTAVALSLVVSATGAAAPGYLTLYPGGSLVPQSSSVNFQAGQTRAGNAVVRLGSGGAGTLGVRNGSSGTTHVILDVNGYFQ